MFTSEIKQNKVEADRIYFLDNLRTFMIFLVVLIHAGGVYENRGNWALFWIVDDPATNSLSDILFSIIDIFVMPVIFFISGYMIPISLKNKSGYQFLKSKIKRLMIPWLIAVLTLIPLYKLIYLYSRGLPQEPWTTYFHWNCGIWSQNWLWFLPVLFLFNLIYIPLSRTNLPSAKISIKFVIIAIFIISFLNSLTMDAFGLRGFTKTTLINFQNERLLIYFMVFLLGSLCFKQKTLTSKPKNSKLYPVVLLTTWIPITLYCFFNMKSSLITNNIVYSEAIDTLLLWSSLSLSLLCSLYLLVKTFSRYFDKPGKLWSEFNKNSYFVYITHVVVMGLIALPLLNIQMASFLKHLVLTVATYVTCNMIISGYRDVTTRVKTNISIISILRKERKMKPTTTSIIVIALVIFTGCSKNEDSNAEIKPPHVSLQVAALQGNTQIIRQHIDAGSDLDVKDEYGSTPLIIATTFGKTETAKILIEGGADLGITNNEGATPLHIAAFFCRTEIVKALIDNGADKNILNKSRSTALETVSRPFEDVKGVYDNIEKAFKPLGLRLDHERIRRTRPEIAQMLSN